MHYDLLHPLMCYDASFVVFVVLKLLEDLLDFQLKQTLKEQQKRIDEQKEMISKQAHLAVQSIQEEQHLKSSLNYMCMFYIFINEVDMLLCISNNSNALMFFS
jgi:anion-transporting  ArsA/GET3 family ATPase